MTSMWVSFFSDLDANNQGQNIAIKWPDYGLDITQNMVFDVNATQLVRVSNDSFREKPISCWMRKDKGFSCEWTRSRKDGQIKSQKTVDSGGIDKR
ncbi:hypothetical protein IWZ01DRAFT_540546 [Phyllosticta capitalensis]